MYRKSLVCLVVVSTGLMFCANCGNQAGTDYPGEVLASVSGIVASEMSQYPEDGVEIMLVWGVSAGSPDYVVGERCDVTGEFPASFKLNLYAAPVDEALNDYSQYDPAECRVGIAHIIVVAAGTEEVPDEDDGSIYGWSEDHLLVYLDKDVPPDSFSERLLHGQLKAGFHLMKALPCEEDTPENCFEGIFDSLVLAEDDLDTPLQIRLVDDLNELRIPNWT